MDDYLDENFVRIKEQQFYLSLDIFKKDLLDELKLLAIKLSEDFPNFIRVDLYVFHDKIYLSELTFDSGSGIPFIRLKKYFNNAAKYWKRIDY